MPARGSILLEIILYASLASTLVSSPADAQGPIDQPFSNHERLSNVSVWESPGHIIQVEAVSIAHTSEVLGRDGPGDNPDDAARASARESSRDHPGDGPRPMRLPPRSTSSPNPLGDRAANGRSAAWTMASSLSMVIGIFLVIVWGLRRQLPRASFALPNDVVRVLGRAPLANRQTMQLVRIGNKLVLLCVTPQGAEPLAEVTDPYEVERLSALCESTSADSMSATFRQVLAQVGDPRISPRSSHRETGFPPLPSGRTRS